MRPVGSTTRDTAARRRRVLNALIGGEELDSRTLRTRTGILSPALLYRLLDDCVKNGLVLRRTAKVSRDGYPTRLNYYQLAAIGRRTPREKS